MSIEIKLLQPGVVAPTYTTQGSAGLDLRNPIGCFTLLPKETVKLHLGFAIWIKDPEYAALIIPRSGLGSKGLIVANSVGLIDSDYQGELAVSMYNRTDKEMFINENERIAQLVFIRVAQASFMEVKEFSNYTKRGEGGFGSTGTK